MLPVEATLAAVRARTRPTIRPSLVRPPACGEPPLDASSILAPRRPGIGRFFFPHSTREADLPAQRAPAEAPARLPRPDVHPCRPRDPQAPPREGPQAPLGLTPLGTRVQRRHRLSRSRDFDAVYRHGRSVSTRFLVLYWFAREEAARRPRLGLAVPKAVGPAVVRNRMKRQLREAFRAAPGGAAAGPGLRARRAPRPRRGRRARAASTGSASASTRSSRRRRRESRTARAGLPRPRPRLRVALHASGCSRTARASTTRPARSTRSTRSAQYGLVRGSVLAGWRLLRCNPWSRGGVDYAHDQRLFR